MRVVAALAVALAVAAAAVVPAEASQAELDRARRRANAAAADLADAQTRLAELEQEISSLEAQRSTNQDKLTGLQSAVKDFAIQQFLHGARGDAVIELPGDVAESARAETLARIVTAGSRDAVDAYQATAEDLALVNERLRGARSEADENVVALRKRITAANAELKKLERLEAERIARERAQRERAAREARRPRPSGGGDGGSRIIGSGSWICPVQGSRAFTNDWGQPRSGGRRHQGTDILSPRGTPVVAPVAGSLRARTGGLGGVAFYLQGTDGNRYYGAHMDRFSGASGNVEAGTVIGYIGNSGNARGGPTHLHFEIQPGGGSPVNPYPTLRQYC